MRILYLAKYYWPHSGGMERVVQDLAEGAAELGHDAEVLAVERQLRPRAGNRSRSRVTRAFSLGNLGSQELAPGYLAAAWRRADVIHLHHPHALADLAWLLRGRRTPLVVTQHADGRGSFLHRWLARTALRRAAAIVVPSRAHIALCEELEGYESKVEVIPFGIEQERWNAVPARDGGGGKTRPRALFIGRLVRFKGVDVLLRALELVPGLGLDVVGSGPEERRLKTLAQALAVSERVRWYGEYPDEDLPRRMADADFLVLPSVSVQEMFGLVLVEAMAAGRPVITTDLPSGVREVNLLGETGLSVPLRDVEALAGAMRTLAGDPEARRRMGEAGRLRAAERFTRREMALRHLALYEKVVAAQQKA